MESLKFAKMDFMRIKGQSKMMILFLVLATFLSIKMQTPLWGLLYVVFGAMIMSSNPFFSDTIVENGFIRLLPAHAGSRVYGRYLYGSAYIFTFSLSGLLVVGINIMIQHEIPDYLLEIYLIVLGVSLFMNAIQFLILSFMTTKNPQILSLIRMIVPFVLFFGGSWFAGEVSEGSAETFGFLQNVIEYAITHLLITSALILLVGVLSTVLCALISARHEINKES